MKKGLATERRTNNRRYRRGVKAKIMKTSGTCPKIKFFKDLIFTLSVGANRFGRPADDTRSF